MRVLREPRFVLPMVVIIALLASAVAPTVLAPMDPSAQDLRAVRKPPWSVTGSGLHVLGTDWLGRDMLSRVIAGARISVLVALAAVAVRGTVGTVMGLFSGYYRGWVDTLFMRLADIELSLPFMLIALVFAVILGPSVRNVILILAVTGWVTYSRLVRSEVLSVRERQFVEAAHAVGASNTRIIFRHVWPNVTAPVIVMATIDVPFMILAESTLSFLGVGVPISTPSWGNMVSLGKTHLTTAWWIPIVPGVAIALTVLSLNMLGDWLRDTLDPNLKGREMQSG